MAQSGDFVVLAVDIGGSKIDMALIDQQGELLSPIEKVPVPFDSNGIADPDGLVSLMMNYAGSNQKLAGAPVSVGLSVCGNIDMETGEAVLVPNLHWRNVQFGAMVSEQFSLPVYAATDVRMAALAEAVWGGARGIDNFAWVTIGTGFGAYLFLDGKLYGGKHGFAGNFGHNTIDEINGYLCGCGRKGCLETFVAGPAIARAGQAALDEGHSEILCSMAVKGHVTTAMVFDAEVNGDAASHEIIEGIIRLTAIGIGGLVNILDLEMIVLGGGVVHGSTDYASRIDRRIRDYLMTVEARRDLRIIKESFPNSALFGAAANVLIQSGAVTL